MAAVSSIGLTSVSAGSSTPSITVDQGLYPAFNLAVHDYVVRCNGSPLNVSVNAPSGYGVSVDGGRLTAGAFNASVQASLGQEFTIVIRHAEVNSSYYVRCLPNDFPQYGFTQQRPAPYAMYAIDTALGRYTAVFDTNGVPLWWMKTATGAGDSQVLRDGTYGFYDKSSGLDQIYSLAAQPIRSLTAINGQTDQHELLLLDNGDYMIDSYVPRCCVDLTPYGGPNNATVLDGEAEEITPAGHLVWSWNSGQHTALSDTPQSWYNRQIPFGSPYDIFHLNAIQPHGPEVLISARHHDAVYGIDRTSGNVLWKLGGITDPQSLRVVGDPQGSYPFGGQHDIRVLPNGTITVHDNNFGISPSIPARAVNYSIDEQARTATFLSAVTDPALTTALCCGSARLMSTGVWLICWGYNPLIAGYDTSGNRLWALTFKPGLFSYRAIPVPASVSVAALRAGMDAQYPRAPGGAPSASFSASRSRTNVARPIAFNATAGDSAAAPTSARWDFGDGKSGTGWSVSHAYAKPGVYLVRLTVHDSAGAATTVSSTVTVLEGAALRPRPSFEVAAGPGRQVGLDGTMSFVERATIVSYGWRLGDGHSASGATIAHRYAHPGRYRVTLTVTSSAGRSSSATRTITVR